jgi:hypothetical protein
MKILVGVIVFILSMAPLAGAQSSLFNSSQGSGWILLSLGDLNSMLEQTGYPSLDESVPIYGGSTSFSKIDQPWQWGITGLFWNSRGGETVSLDSSFLGGVLDWTVRDLSNGRFSAGVSGGFGFSRLSIRKDLAFDFADVLDPNEGQFSVVQRWGFWGAPYIQYQLSVLNSGFEAKIYGGFLATPWLSGWSQESGLLAPVDFAGPPSSLGGPFFMAEISFGF